VKNEKRKGKTICQQLTTPNQQLKMNPPQLPLRFFRWFCHPELRDSIEGDLMELYEEWVREKGKRKANIKLMIDVLLLFRPGIISINYPKHRINTYDMFRHNLLIAFRSFLRYKSSFLINLTGLSSGLACVLLIYLWVNDELHVDQFHVNKDRLYQVRENVEQDGEVITRITTSGPTAEALAKEMPEVEYAVTNTFDRIFHGVLSTKENDIKTGGIYASADFFRLFTYDLIQGNKDQVLADKKSIVITEDLAKRLFGTSENVVGKAVEWQHKKQYLVSGVLKDISSLSSVQFDFILTLETFTEDNDWMMNWFNTAPQTFVLLKEGTNVEAFNKKIADLVRTKTEGKVNHRTPFISPYTDAYLYGKYENGQQVGGRIEYVRLFSIIALFIVLIACINFMNLSTARASRRMKEVGMKKVVGARKSTLVFQYLSESTLICLLSLVMALLLVVLFLPQFNSIVGKNLTVQFDLNFMAGLLGVVLLTGLIAGSYPAFYLSTFTPATVLKGKLNNFMSEARVRKGLVVFQFTLSIILIVSVWVVYKQIEFIQTKNLGYSKDHVIIIRSEGALSEKRETFISEIQQMPGVMAASSGQHSMTGHNGGTHGIEWPGKNPEDRTEFENMPVNYGLIELLGISLKEGRLFAKSYADSSSIIFNEAAIKFMGIADPIGKEVKLWGRTMQIVGVVNDFHFESFHEKIKPAFFWLNPNAFNIMVKVEAGKEQNVISQLEEFNRVVNPGFPLDYHFLDTDYQTLYAAESRVSTLSKYFAGLAIIISCLGLFGLAAFTTERRVKEIGIRKVLGSSQLGIVYLLSSEFTRVVLVSIIVALPASYLVATYWLDGFAFKIQLEWWYFIASGLLALGIAWLTVGTQALRAAKANPVDSLRSE
jgi:predicted permease